MRLQKQVKQIIKSTEADVSIPNFFGLRNGFFLTNCGRSDPPDPSMLLLLSSCLTALLFSVN